MKGETALALSCICTASSRLPKEVSYFYLVRDERDGRFDFFLEGMARAIGASHGANSGNYVA